VSKVSDTNVTTHSSSRPSLEKAQKAVGGYVEMHHLAGGEQMLMNEDARALRLPVNEAASDLLGVEVRGDVLVLSGDAKWS